MRIGRTCWSKASVNDPPTLNTIADANLLEDAGQQTVNLTGITAGAGESQTLWVTASTNNETRDAIDARLTPGLQAW